MTSYIMAPIKKKKYNAFSNCKLLHLETAAVFLILSDPSPADMKAKPLVGQAE